MQAKETPLAALPSGASLMTCSGLCESSRIRRPHLPAVAPIPRHRRTHMAQPEPLDVPTPATSTPAASEQAPDVLVDDPPPRPEDDHPSSSSPAPGYRLPCLPSMIRWSRHVRHHSRRLLPRFGRRRTIAWRSDELIERRSGRLTISPGAYEPVLRKWPGQQSGNRRQSDDRPQYSSRDLALRLPATVNTPRLWSAGPAKWPPGGATLLGSTEPSGFPTSTAFYGSEQAANIHSDVLTADRQNQSSAATQSREDA